MLPPAMSMREKDMATEVLKMATASSRATTPKRVVVKGPLALYSWTMAKVAAGAVAHDTAPIIMAIGR